MASICGVVRRMKAYLAMIFVQFGTAGAVIFTTTCLKRGMSTFILVFYRSAVATTAMAPFAYYFERQIRPKMTISIFLKIVGLAILSVADQNVYSIGLKCTTATFSTALFNVVPALTFLFTVILRKEKIKIKERSTQAKIMGTVISLGGAMMMTLYKGTLLDAAWSRERGHQETNSTNDAGNHQDWVKGTIFLTLDCLCWSFFFILQSFTVQDYPGLSLSSMICLVGVVLSVATAVVFDHNPKDWAVGWDTRIITPIYTGIISSGITYYFQGLAMKEKGTIFVTSFNPLMAIIVAIMGCLILAEEIYLGQIVGAIIIMIGLYSVLWGKRKEIEAIEVNSGGLELPLTTDDEKKPGRYAGMAL